MLTKAWQHKQMQPLDNVDFEHLNLSSTSEWDRYVRGLTPDIQTCLSNLIPIDKTTVTELEYIWCLASEDLNHRQKKALIDWYCSIAYALTGAAVKLPCLSLSLAVTAPWVSQAQVDVRQT